MAFSLPTFLGGAPKKTYDQYSTELSALLVQARNDAKSYNVASATLDLHQASKKALVLAERLEAANSSGLAGNTTQVFRSALQPPEAITGLENTLSECGSRLRAAGEKYVKLRGEAYRHFTDLVEKNWPFLPYGQWGSGLISVDSSEFLEVFKKKGMLSLAGLALAVPALAYTVYQAVKKPSEPSA